MLCKGNKTFSSFSHMPWERFIEMCYVWNNDVLPHMVSSAVNLYHVESLIKGFFHALFIGRDYKDPSWIEAQGMQNKIRRMWLGRKRKQTAGQNLNSVGKSGTRGIISSSCSVLFLKSLHQARLIGHACCFFVDTSEIYLLIRLPNIAFLKRLGIDGSKSHRVVAWLHTAAFSWQSATTVPWVPWWIIITRATGLEISFFKEAERSLLRAKAKQKRDLNPIMFW